ncbi:hypothetical protein BaRGS_00009900 [Batillaria attramentaria]|uniref:Uncharacterized protein n=1 Tax=Batillaria attramentaria TaxID=370345 RepID=A0ABD0LI13_9CAEN
MSSPQVLNGTNGAPSSSSINGTTQAATGETHVKELPEEDLTQLIERLTELLDSNVSMTSAEKAKCFRQRAECHLRLGNNNAALVDAEAALHEDPREVEATVTGGQAAASLGRFKDAFHLYKAGLQQDPDSKVITEQLRQLQSHIQQKSESQQEEEEPTYNALDFCTQDPYPGDDVQLKLEREILEAKYKISDKLSDFSGKKMNQAEAAKQLKHAYEAVTRGRLDQALAHCARAIEADPSNIFGRKFRAQLNFDRQDIVEALKDCWAIPKGSRTPDVWNMGGKVLVQLWLPVTAEFWLRKATVTSGRRDQEAGVLFQKVRVKRLYGPLTEDFPVAVDFTQFGRAVVAKEDVKVLMKDLPLVHAQTLASRFVPACCHCTRSLITATDYFGDNYNKLTARQKDVVAHHWPEVTQVWCPRCSRELYCSKQCQEAGWEDYHRVLCPSVNKAAEKLYDLRDHDGYGTNAQGRWAEIWGGHYSPFVLAKLWAAILCQVRRIMQEEGPGKDGQPTTVQWAKAKAPYRRFIAFGTAPATERMPDILAIFQEVFSDCPDGVSYPITEAEFKGRYYQAACNLQCFSACITPFQRFMTSLQEDLEGLSLLVHLDEHKIPEAYFAGMFPVHACLNHSCENNAEVSNGHMDDNFGVQVTAKRDIKKGEEIFITYIDTALPRMLRRAWLYKSFNFWCQCRRCQFEGDKPTECTQCGAKAKGDKRFPTCGKCHKAWYCSTKCQKENWVKGHKIICSTKHSVVASPEDYQVC